MDPAYNIKPRKSIGNPNFHTLPSRGTRRSKELGTKSIINSETFFQTKTLLYADHQQSHHSLIEKSPRNGTSTLFSTNSMDSLNSSTDPDIVAALDQIASRMGLISEKVNETSVDPVNYLLKTSSFSEKISIYKRSPSTNYHENQVRSLNREPNSKTTNPDVKIQSQWPDTPVLRKKESSFKKMIQRFSPKASRRIKSSPSTIVTNPDFDSNYESRVNGKTSVVGATKSYNVPNPIKIEEIPAPILHETGTNEAKISNNTSALVNSTCFNLAEDSQVTLHNKPINGFCHNLQQFPDSEISKNEIQLENEMTIQLNTSEAPLQCSSKIENTSPVIQSHASYIHISLSAFGYGPKSSLRRSPNFRKREDSIKNAQWDFRIPNASGDQYYCAQR